MRIVQVAAYFAWVLLGGCAIVGSGGGDYIVRGEVGYLNLSPDGDLSLSNSVIGTKTTVEDLGLDDRESQPYGKASLRFGANELSLSGFQADFSGKGTLPISTSFGDIPGGADVDSSLDFTNLKLLYRWYLVDLDVFSFGPGLGVDYFDLEAEVSSSGFTVQDFSPEAPIPVPGVSGELRVGPLRAFADLYAIQATVGDTDGAFYDLEGGLKLAPLSNVDVVVGYRLIRFQAEGSETGGLLGTQNFDVDYKLPGLFFSAGVRF